MKDTEEQTAAAPVPAAAESSPVGALGAGPLASSHTAGRPPGMHRAVSLLRMQRVAGNAALARLLQREGEGGGAGGGAPGGAPAPGAAPGPGGEAAPGGASQQNVKIVTDQGEQELPIPQAVAFISNKVDFTDNKVNLMAGEHEMLKKQREDSIATSVIGAIADVFAGFQSMPDVSIWSKPKQAVAAARTAIAASDPVAAGNSLKEANDSYQDALKEYLTYKEGNFQGADTTISVLKAIILVDAAVGAALSGGATVGAGAAVAGGEAGAAGGTAAAVAGGEAAAAGGTAAAAAGGTAAAAGGTAAAGGAAAGGTAATVGASGAVTQAVVAGAVGAEGAAIGDVGSQVAGGKPFDWAELAEKTGAGFASGFLAACVSGPLKAMLSESCSGYVTEELMSDADLAEIAKSLGVEKIERDFLQSQLKQYIIGKVAQEAGKWLIGKPIEMVVQQMQQSSTAGGAPPDAPTAVDTAAKVAAPLIAAAFKAAVKSGQVSGGSGAGGSAGGAPAGGAPPGGGSSGGGSSGGAVAAPLRRKVAPGAAARGQRAGVGAPTRGRRAGEEWVRSIETAGVRFAIQREATAPAAGPPGAAPTSGPGAGPVMTASGVDALKALVILKTAQPYTAPGGAMGDVTLIPGTAFGGKILLYASPLTTYYIDGQSLYEAHTPDFVRDMWLTAFIQGVENAAWLQPLIKAEFALIEGLIAPWYLMLGLSIFEGLVFAHEHWADIQLLLQNYQTLLKIRAELKSKCPTLYDKCFSAALMEVLRDLPEGVELADIAYFVGRVFGGSGIAGSIEKGVEITAKVVVKIVAEYAILIALIHGPAAAARGVKAALSGEVAKFKQTMAEDNIPLTDADALQILTEMSGNESIKDTVNQLSETAESIATIMKRLQAK